MAHAGFHVDVTFGSSSHTYKCIVHLSILLLLLVFCLAAREAHCRCDRVFRAPSAGNEEDLAAADAYTRKHTMVARQGRFEAPIRSHLVHPPIWRNETTCEMWLGHNPTITRSRHKSMFCLYTFVANKGEQVVLSFNSSRMRGSEPDCVSEYVDIYAKFRSDEPIEAAIGNELPMGRFCTIIVPTRVVSLHNLIVLAIYSDLAPPFSNTSMFDGTFEFVKPASDTQQQQQAGGSPRIGPPERGTLCTHTIYSDSQREGEFQSINYPGIYLKDHRCAYKFIGAPGQRVRLEFLDLDIYSGGAHCPMDSFRVFDGLEESDPLIQLICGSHRSLIIYSTNEHMLLTFTSLRRGQEILNRGYSAYFEFSDKFFQPNFIQGPHARHIRGTECDQRIVSTKGSRGFIESPDAKTNHPSSICRYFFEGLQSSHDYEKVLLKFTEFDLKTPSIGKTTKAQQSLGISQSVGSVGSLPGSSASLTPPSGPFAALATADGLNSSSLLLLNQALNFTNYTTTNSSTTNDSANNSNNNNSNNNSNSNNSTQVDLCPDNYVRLYTGEQKPDQKQDPNDYDYVFCSNEVPATIESDAASLLMEYNSGSLGGYFRAEYSFIVDYRISGYQIPQFGCNYVYRSDFMKTGTFNSPRHPSWYINDMNCTFTLLTRSDEALLMQFTSFKMAKSFKDGVVGFNEVCNNEDSVEISEINLDSDESGSARQLRSHAGRDDIGLYCGLTSPGPILSYRPVQVNFRTNADQVDYGFSATYHFHSVAELKNNEFVSNCGEQIQTHSRLRNGTFASPSTYRSETYEKRNHICTWDIIARNGYKIALNFTVFELEGSLTGRGCSAATVRLEYDSTKLPTELCGSWMPNDKGDSQQALGSHQFVSREQRMMVTFISTKRASGSNGFIATWMEIKAT